MRTTAVRESTVTAVTAVSTPRAVIAGIIVNTFQCPWGTAATSRSPSGHRPRSRAMFVDAALSSITTSRSSGTPFSCSCHASRRSRTSGRDCSAACADFL